MKNQMTKRLLAFIVPIMMGMMFSGNAIAQINNGGGCICSDPHYGCGYNTKCILHCASICGHHVMIGNSESNSTTVSFFIEQSEKVSLKIYDMTGRLVTTLAENSFEAGNHFLSLNIK